MWKAVALIAVVLSVGCATSPEDLRKEDRATLRWLLDNATLVNDWKRGETSKDSETLGEVVETLSPQSRAVKQPDAPLEAFAYVFQKDARCRTSTTGIHRCDRPTRLATPEELAANPLPAR